MDLGLRGRVALVSGASEGIGRAVALDLLREGARVAIRGRRADVLEAAAEGLRAEVPKAQVLPIPADVTLAAAAVTFLASTGGLNRSTHHPLDRMMTGGVRGLHNGAGGRAVDQVAAG
ncbi:MAG: SDR family NAD(P)-dependent oxidoreductase [Chloroflexi bacterium]|nr:SDR family NAD(P)-dependent oxidoreductase [Chloroflexota bacterium]